MSKHPRYWLPEAETFGELRKKLKDVYGKDFNVFAGKHHARYLPDNIPVHMISRVFQGRFLMRPSPKLNRLVAGVIAQAQKHYPAVKLYGAVMMSNHFHMMAQGPARQLVDFIAFIKREISRRWGGDPEINWPGSMWESYLVTALPTAESQVQCLKYILSHGVKEKLVARPEQWPGVHCAAALAGGKKLEGEWLNGTAYRRAKDAQSRRKKPAPVSKRDYTTQCEVRFDPIPAWANLTENERRAEIRMMLDAIEKEGREIRGGRPPLGAKRVMELPLDLRSDLPPQPWFEERNHMICWADPHDRATHEFQDGYWTFQLAFRAASEALRDGDLSVEFPTLAFRPGYHQSANAANAPPQ